LASEGIDPQHDVEILTLPPAQMIAGLKKGTIDGYSIGEPWATRAAIDNIGYEIATDLDIWNGHPGKVLGVREEWALAYPNTHIALVKALLEACQFCAAPANQDEVREILAQSEYLAMDHDYIYLSDSQQIACNVTKNPRDISHPLFFADGANRPSRTEHLWLLTQMARWGDVPFPRNWVEILERVAKVGVFSTAARELGLATSTSYNRKEIDLFDGIKFTADDPIDYLNHFAIKHDIYMAEIDLSGRD